MTDTLKTMLYFEQHKKSAVIACILNVIWFGAGYAYTGSNTKAGLLALFVTPVTIILCTLHFPLILGYLACCVIFGITAVNGYNAKLLEGLQ